MKPLVFAFLATLFLAISAASSFAQSSIDAVYMKNGDIVRGEIIENVLNRYVRIRLSGAYEVELKYSDIEKIKKEDGRSAGAAIDRDIKSPRGFVYLSPSSGYTFDARPQNAAVNEAFEIFEDFYDQVAVFFGGSGRGMTRITDGPQPQHIAVELGLLWPSGLMLSFKHHEFTRQITDTFDWSDNLGDSVNIKLNRTFKFEDDALGVGYKIGKGNYLIVGSYIGSFTANYHENGTIYENFSQFLGKPGWGSFGIDISQNKWHIEPFCTAFIFLNRKKSFALSGSVLYKMVSFDDFGGYADAKGRLVKFDFTSLRGDFGLSHWF